MAKKGNVNPEANENENQGNTPGTAGSAENRQETPAFTMEAKDLKEAIAGLVAETVKQVGGDNEHIDPSIESAMVGVINRNAQVIVNKAVRLVKGHDKAVKTAEWEKETLVRLLKKQGMTDEQIAAIVNKQ